MTPDEVAEQEAYLADLAVAEESTRRLVVALQTVWCDVSGLTWSPAEWVLRNMLVNNSLLAVEDAMRVVAPKVASGYLRKADWVRYAWGVLRTAASRAAYEREQPARADAILASVLDDGEETR